MLARLGLARVSWSGRGFDTVDGDDRRVLARLVRALAPGAILLLHEGGPPGRAPSLLAGLLAEMTGAVTACLPARPGKMPAPLPGLADWLNWLPGRWPPTRRRPLPGG